MTIKSALSVVALTVAFSGAAFAQGMMINGTAVSETDMPAVQERCTQLSTAQTTEPLSTTEDADSEATATDGNSGSGSSTAGVDATTEATPSVNEVQNATTTIDLDTISLQACIDGGFVTQ